MMNKIGVAAVCMSLLLGPSTALARGKNKEKSERVGSYTRKDGKKVKEYKRRPADTKATDTKVQKRKRTR